MRKTSRTKIKVSIVVVYYRGIRKLIRTLKSIFDQKTKYFFEVIVVDNSNEKEVEKTVKGVNKSIFYIKSGKNLGYGAGNNLGARFAKGEYLFILNPDTEVRPKAFDTLVSILERKRNVGIVAPFLVDYKANVFSLQGTRELTPIQGIFALSFLNKVFPNNFVSRHYFMKHIPLETLREVDVVPGAAFVIRKDLFERIGGFDENFFLYFEENDLCKRVKEAGWKIFMTPQAQVVHFWRPKRGIRLKKTFQKSRFYYFKKHFGIFWALIVEVFARLSKWTAIFFSIFIISVFLRFYKIGELTPFIGDFGWYYLQARDMLLTSDIPLVGISSSVPILRQGAIWTWMLALSLFLGRFHPLSGAYLSGFLGILGLLTTFYLSKAWFGRRVAYIALFLASTFPLLLFEDRQPFITSGIFPLTALISICFDKVTKGLEKYWFFLGFWLGIIFQFELASLIMIPIVLLGLFFAKIKPSPASALKFVLGGIFGILPFLFWDLRQGVYIQTIGFLFWLFLKIFENARLSIIFIILCFAFLMVFSKYLRRLDFLKKFLIIWLVLGLGSFYVRGVFAQAYLPIIFLPTILLISLSVDWLFAKKFELGLFSLSTIIFLNLFYFAAKINKFAEEGVGLQEAIRVATFIVESSKGEEFSLRYLGPQYMFEAGDNHWRYLLWWKGNEPKIGKKLIFTIAESPYNLKGKFDATYNFKNIGVGLSRND